MDNKFKLLEACDQYLLNRDCTQQYLLPVGTTIRIQHSEHSSTASRHPSSYLSLIHPSTSTSDKTLRSQYSKQYSLSHALQRDQFVFPVFLLSRIHRLIIHVFILSHGFVVSVNQVATTLFCDWEQV